MSIVLGVRTLGKVPKAISAQHGLEAQELAARFHQFSVSLSLDDQV